MQVQPGTQLLEEVHGSLQTLDPLESARQMPLWQSDASAQVAPTWPTPPYRRR